MAGANGSGQAARTKVQPTPQVRAAHLSVMAAFVMAGVTFATWASRIPDVKDALELTPSRLGLVLIAMSAGSVLALPSAGWVVQRLGVARTVLGGTVLVAIGFTIAGVGTSAGSIPLVAAGLFLGGLGVGSWDVAMNVEGADVERHLGRTVMPHYHAGFSIGTVGAAGLGALASWARVPVVLHLVLASVLAVVVVAWAVRRFLPHVQVEEGSEEHAARRHPLSYFREPRTLLVGVVVLAAAFTEGSANDWLSVAIRDGYGTESWVGVLGFAAFVTAMTIGRVLGTAWLDRYGRVKVLWAAFALAAVGALLVILGPAIGLVAAFAGALLWGVGASLGFPVGMSAAADDAQHAAARVSVVASIGYCAFLAGPPLLGFLGDHYGVLQSLFVVVALTIPALLVVPATKPLPGSEAEAKERAAASVA